MINVIGSGIAGSLVTRLLRKNGHEVLVFDDEDKFSGSRASSNLYVGSWLRKFTSEQAYKGIKTLESLFPSNQINKPFSRGIADAIKVKHIAQKHLLVEPDVKERVIGVSLNSPSELITASGRVFEGKTVLCTGWRAFELLEGFKPSVLVGHCLLINGKLEPGMARLTMPLPYRHEKLYQFDENTIYFADSTRLTLKAWESRKDELRNELLNKFWTKNLPNWETYSLKEYRVGFRPIVEGYDFGQLRRVADSVWLVNGGGKNGLVAYAYQASRLLEEI